MQVFYSIIRMKRNKMSNLGPRQRKTPQPPPSPPPPTVSPLSYQRDEEEEEPTLWPNQRGRSAGQLNPPQFVLPPRDPFAPNSISWNPHLNNQLVYGRKLFL
jgi:hypothetical protein